jgi:3-methyladenine DNA glycosylase/8-oxoguanine DNA glycosylase
MTGRTRIHQLVTPLDLRGTLGPLQHGRFDPALRFTDIGVWWATETPDGPGTLRLVSKPSERAVVGTAFGPGSSWLLEQLPAVVGAHDDPGEFSELVADRFGGVLANAWHQHQQWRVPATGRAFEAAAAAVIEQKVTGGEARDAWRQLLQRFGEPAPGSPPDGPAPDRMHAPPTPQVWRQIPDWDFRRAGVTPARIRGLRTVASAAAAIERTTKLGSVAADRMLRRLPGVGEWTSAEIRARAHGDADAISFGDFHVAKNVCWWLTGERGDDAQMRELLRPFVGHRYRVQRLMELTGAGAPRRGPRFAPPSHRFA